MRSELAPGKESLLERSSRVGINSSSAETKLIRLGNTTTVLLQSYRIDYVSLTSNGSIKVSNLRKISLLRLKHRNEIKGY